MCGVNSVCSTDLGTPQALSLLSSTTYDVTDVRDCVLLYDEMSPRCSSELVMIHLKGSADPQDEVKS